MVPGAAGEGPTSPRVEDAAAPNHKKKTVRSTRLSSEAQIRNRLLPKTRSWFALDAPLELLSSLSVVRIVFALNVLTWTLATLFLANHSVRIPAVAIALGTALLTWLLLEVVHRLDARWVFILLSIATAQITLLTWAASGSPLAWVFAISCVPVGIAAALFLPFRSLLVQQLLSCLGLLVAFAGGLGYAPTFVVAASIG